MAEVEETAREFEELAIAPSVPPPPPYVERNEETLSGRVATLPLRTPSLGLTDPQLYHRDIIAPPDFSTLVHCVAAFCGWFCICTLPCVIAAVVLEKKVCIKVTIHQASCQTDHQIMYSHGISHVAPRIS